MQTESEQAALLTVKVRLRKPTRVFTFLCEDLALRRDDGCIVRTDRGLEYGTCVLPPEVAPPDAEERFKMAVVRRATLTDESTLHQLVIEEQKAKELCAQRIRERKLPMKLVDAEYTFDRHKITFYFTAADRVDFRQLVRDLAQHLRTRIELRHIQVRDEARITGGIGVCGRELCCSTWLGEFKPISMKMAKRQNLSLNPSKISGQCGRLLCCLAYENEQYPGRRSKGSEAVAEQRMREMADEEEGLGAIAFAGLDYANGDDLDEVFSDEGAELDERRPPARGREKANPREQQNQGPPVGAGVGSADEGGDASKKRRRRRRKKRPAQEGDGAPTETSTARSSPDDDAGDDDE